jgi:hypothetical protein
MYACVLIVCYYLPAIESNDKCAEKGEVFEYQEEEDQGLANQGKCRDPGSKLYREVMCISHTSNE